MIPNILWFAFWTCVVVLFVGTPVVGLLFPRFVNSLFFNAGIVPIVTVWAVVGILILAFG